MPLFWVLFQKLVPLYSLVFLGFISARVGKVGQTDIARLLLYIISPIVIFSSLLQTEITASRLSLPFLFLMLCSLMGLAVFRILKRFPASERSILAFACGSGNTGYFGLPLVLFLLGPNYIGLAILCALGFTLYENSLGFYLAARGRSSAREAFRKVVRLPVVYATALALLFKFFGWRLPATFDELGVSFRGAYTVLGMFLVGIGVGHLKRTKINYRFLAVAFGCKFLVWPSLVAAWLFIDAKFFHFQDAEARQVLPLMSIVPLPAITVAIAATLKTEPEQSALAVLLSTLFALAYIPWWISF